MVKYQLKQQNIDKEIIEKYRFNDYETLKEYYKKYKQTKSTDLLKFKQQLFAKGFEASAINELFNH